MSTIKALKGAPDKSIGLFAESVSITELPDQEHMDGLVQIYQNALQEADEKQASTLVFPSLPLAEQLPVCSRSSTHSIKRCGFSGYA